MPRTPGGAINRLGLPNMRGEIFGGIKKTHTFE